MATIDWIDVTPISGASGETAVVITPSENNSPSARTIVLKVSTDDLNEEINIWQEAGDYIMFNPSGVTLSSNSAITSTQLLTNDSWSLSGVPAWMSINPTTGSGDTTLTVAVDKNESGISGRTATIYGSTDEIFATYSIDQGLNDKAVIIFSGNLVSNEYNYEGKVNTNSPFSPVLSAYNLTNKTLSYVGSNTIYQMGYDDNDNVCYCSVSGDPNGIGYYSILNRRGFNPYEVILQDVPIIFNKHSFIGSSFKTINIPNGSTVKTSAFTKCYCITNLSIGNDVEFEAGAFYSGFSLSSAMTVTIGTGVTFDENTFSGVGYLFTVDSTITFNGTMSQWNTVTFPDKIRDNIGFRYVQCTDGIIELPISKYEVRYIDSNGQKGQFYNTSIIKTQFIESGESNNGITQLEIGSGIYQIHNLALYGSNITRITFDGTVDEWANIERANYSTWYTPENFPGFYGTSVQFVDCLDGTINMEVPSQYYIYAHFNGNSNFAGGRSTARISVGDIDTYDYYSPDSPIYTLGDYIGWQGDDIQLLDLSHMPLVTLNNWGVMQNSGILRELRIPSTLTTFGNQAFVYSKLPEEPQNGNIISLGDSAFDYAAFPVVNCYTGVTNIPDYCYAHNSNLLAVNIPDSVVNIGNRAFISCNSISSLTLGNRVESIGDYAFALASGITEVVFPNTIKNIGTGAFQGCYALGSVAIQSNSAVTINNNAFYNCSGLSSVTITNALTIGESAFSGCSNLANVYIGSGEISSSAFTNCYNLVTLGLGTGVTNINDYAFNNCRSITAVTIPNSVQNIGNKAFMGCSSMSSLTVENGVEYIGEKAFSGCSSLTNVYIGSGEIGSSAFTDCYSLVTLGLGSGVTSIGNDAFAGCIGIQSLVIPGSISSIGKKAFYLSTGLTSLTIEDGVQIIKEDAFHCCYSLQSVTIPDSVSVIEYRAFSCDDDDYDVGFTSLIIGSGVQSIGEYAFVSIKLANITYNGTIAQWEQVSKGQDWVYRALTNVVHCTDGDVPV